MVYGQFRDSEIQGTNDASPGMECKHELSAAKSLKRMQSTHDFPIRLNTRA